MRLCLFRSLWRELGRRSDRDRLRAGDGGTVATCRSERHRGKSVDGLAKEVRRLEGAGGWSSVCVCWGERGRGGMGRG